MNILQVVAKRYVFLAAMVMCLTWFTFVSTASPVIYNYVIMMGILTFVLYNYHTLFTIDYTSIKAKWKDNKIRLSVIVTLMTCLGLMLILSLSEVFIFFLASVVAVAYFVPILQGIPSLRSILWLKPISIGIVFAMVTATIPYHLGGYSWNESMSLSLGRLFFVTTLAIIFDIGDMAEDHLQKVHTIPEKYGIIVTKIIASVLLLLATLVETYGTWVFLIDFKGLVALLITYLVTWIILLLANGQRKWWYFLILVDGMMGIPYLMLLLFG